MYNEQQTKVLIALGNILEYQQDATRNGIYSQTMEQYKEEYIKMRDEANKKVQINLALIADALEIPRNQMPGLYPEYFDYNEEE